MNKHLRPLPIPIGRALERILSTRLIEADTDAGRAKIVHEMMAIYHAAWPGDGPLEAIIAAPFAALVDAVVRAIVNDHKLARERAEKLKVAIAAEYPNGLPAKGSGMRRGYYASMARLAVLEDMAARWEARQ